MNTTYVREDTGELVELFCLTEEETSDLYNFLEHRVGYISYEFDMGVIKIVRRLRKHFKEKNEAERLKDD